LKCFLPHKMEKHQDHCLEIFKEYKDVILTLENDDHLVEIRFFVPIDHHNHCQKENNKKCGVDAETGVHHQTTTIQIEINAFGIDIIDHGHVCHQSEIHSWVDYLVETKIVHINLNEIIWRQDVRIEKEYKDEDVEFCNIIQRVSENGNKEFSFFIKNKTSL